MQGGPSTTPGTGVKRERSPSVKDEIKDELDAPPSQEIDEHFATLRTDVVGVQYYRGMVGKGEYVMLQRQPTNQYDANAVQVLNAARVQVGHIPRAVAAKIAALMDDNLITVEGRMVGQNLDMAKHYKLGMDMSIFVKASVREVLEPSLRWAAEAERARAQASPAKVKGKGRVLATLPGGGSGSGVPAGPIDPQLAAILEGLHKAEHDDKQSDQVMNTLTENQNVSKLPLHPAPPGIANGQLLVDILPHQSQALQWMVERENPVLPTSATQDVQFWTRQTPQKAKPYWLNVATRTPQHDEPVLGLGGIIADGMGLGKTLTVLSLVLATKGDAVPGYSNATLIVLSNWEKQVREHVTPGQLSLYTYHGQSRGVSANTLKQYDVVLTTYQTVAADMAGSASKDDKKAKTGLGPLGKVKWKRVVADEGHVLKNPKAKMTQGFAALSADRRWVCTGTPIVNSAADLGSLLTCIQVCKPLDQPDYFKALLLRPLRSGDPAASADAAKLLQALVRQMLLRRTKESKDASGRNIVDLPEIEFFQCDVELDEETRLLYDAACHASKTVFERAVREGRTGAVNVLSMLTRLRQLCLSQDLVQRSWIDDVRSGAVLNAQDDQPPVAAMNIPPERREQLLEKLKRAVEDNEECPICCDELERRNEPRITDCGHPACLGCYAAWLVKNNSCPQCRHTITLASLLELPPEDVDGEVDGDVPVVTPTTIKSAKIDELVRFLRAFPADEKTLVFSQFTTFLTHVGARLEAEGMAYVRFDGSMTAKKRQDVIGSFQRAGGPRVMLISLKSGAVGLNLTAASNVFLCDPWWQSAIEAQAIDRVHRMGQRRTVRVFQLIAADTIESRVLAIQKRKDALVAKAFEHSTKETARERREARLEDIRMLFENSA